VEGGDTLWADLEAPCEVEIVSTYPLDGAVDFYYRADLEVQLDGVLDQSELAISLHQLGSTIPGTSRYDEESEILRFDPDDPLEPATSYSALVSSCLGEEAFGFATSCLGCEPVESYEDRVYLLDIDSARFLEPENLGPLLVEIVDYRLEILLGILRADEVLSLLVALPEQGSDPAVQDLCWPTTVLPPADFSSSPYFALQTEQLEVAVGDQTLLVHDLRFSATFAADGSYLGGGQLQGEADARDMIDFSDKITSADELCELAMSFGVDCQTCSSDGLPYCFPLHLDQIEGDELQLELVEVGLGDCED